ncbi:MAG: DUF2889 domain-containing protein [Candidatus Rokubacteria bacterium]|nr:DUF2889 domain-containing protein [Candidatus Rokubacteria bacterium]MBI3826974.1 DUF2889 domain-containing protein [Candidatus Rokubacteria bacterium]
MIAVPRLIGRERWERVMDGWIDDAPGQALRHTVRLREPDREVEVTATALPSPDYRILAAACHPLAGEVDAAVTKGFADLAGAAMVAGFTRRVAEATGRGAGSALVVDAAVEIARLSRQVAKLPRERAERALAGPEACWELDTTGWVDLPDSCFTYSAAGRALFATRTVAASMHPDFYSPRPGQERIFVRRKVARLERVRAAEGERLRLFQSMHDNVHGFDVTYEVDTATGRIVRADSMTPRLPYAGICSEPQGRIASLVGERLDGGLRTRIQTLLGGATGCAQLYDLTADLLKLASG